MNIKRLAGIVALLFIFIMGCSGNYGILKYQSKSESKATKRELIDNWSDYDIWLIYHTAYKPPRLIAIVFYAKNDNRELMLEGIGSKVKVKDKEMWTEVLKENTTSDGELALVWSRGGRSSTGVVEIWGPDNQLYGFMVYQEYAVEVDRVQLVDDNALRLWYKRYKTGGGGK
jgi:hypothetical protein